jgi:hypothetical protein
VKTSTTYPADQTGFAVLTSFENWITRQQPIWENNRFGISAVGIFMQVTVAAVMIAVLGMAGAPAWVFTTGIFFAFMADSLAFAQSSMKVIIVMFLASMLVNASLTVYYILAMAGY